jgi:hypothetical protein
MHFLSHSMRETIMGATRASTHGKSHNPLTPENMADRDYIFAKFPDGE